MEFTALVIATVSGLAGFLLGSLLFGTIVQSRSRARSEQLRIELARSELLVSELEKEIVQIRPQYQQLQQEGSLLRVEIAELKKQREADTEKLSWLNDAQGQMREAFESLASKTLQTNSDEFLKRTGDQLTAVVVPLKENLSSLDQQVRELETKREGAFKGLEEQLRQLSTTHSDLQQTTVSLTQALRSPTVRGRWGEMQLRRVVEMAGMVKNVQFVEQPNTAFGRPDMLMHLPNGGILPLDAKVPLEAYLDAMQSNDDNERKQKLARPC